MDNFEVAFQSDDQETNLPRSHTDARQRPGVEENADSTVEKLVPASVVHEAVGYEENDGDESEDAGQEIHQGLVDDQRVDAAAKLSTCP